jgi:predicted PurR-regulated permease PerM
MAETIVRQERTENVLHPIRNLTDDIFEIVAKLGLLLFLIYWSIVLLRPFLSVLVWSIILAVTLHPAFSWLERLLGGRR